MCKVLEFEADRAVITVTANTCGLRDLHPEDRRKLYPNIGTLVDVHDELSATEEIGQMKDKLKCFPEFAEMFDDSRAMGDDRSKKSVEKKFLAKAVELYKDAMTRQFQYGVFYGWVKLKELEIHNLFWISECVVQGVKNRIHEFTPITS